MPDGDFPRVENETAGVRTITADPVTWPIKCHPAAANFKMMDKAELRALADDIDANGQLEPVKLLRTKTGEMLIIDGRNRIAAAIVTGKADVFKDGMPRLPHHIIEETDGFDAVGYVDSENLYRRHLLAADRDEALARIKAAAPAKSTRTIAAETSIPKSTVARALSAAPVPNGTPGDGKVVGIDGKRYSASKPAPRLSREQQQPPPLAKKDRHDETIVSFSKLLERDLGRELDAVVRVSMTRDMPAKVQALSKNRREELTRKFAAALDCGHLIKEASR